MSLPVVLSREREEGRSLSLIRWALSFTRDALPRSSANAWNVWRERELALCTHPRARICTLGETIHYSKSARAIASCMVLEQYELRVTNGVMDDRRSATCILRVNIAKTQQVLSLHPCLNYMSTLYETPVGHRSAFPHLHNYGVVIANIRYDPHGCRCILGIFEEAWFLMVARICRENESLLNFQVE